MSYPNHPPVSAAANDGDASLRAGEKVRDAAIAALEAPKLSEFKNDIYDAELSSVGGTIQRLAFKGEKRKSGVSHVDFYQGEASSPGIFGVRLAGEPGDLARSQFQLEPQQEKRELFQYAYEKAGDYKITKKYFFGDKEPIIGLDVALQNLSSNPRTFSLILDYAMLAKGDSKETISFESVVMSGQKIKETQLQKLKKKNAQTLGEISWAGLVKKYFAILIKPESKAMRQESWAKGSEMYGSLYLEPVTVPAGASSNQQFFIYAGPQRYEVLESFNSGFEDVLSKGFFGAFKIWLLKSLKFFEHYTHNFGWAILLLTLILKLLFAPLTHMSFDSMRRMQAIQPKVKSLQERYKKDPQKMNQEMMELYKKHRVNPLGGCLPMLLQIPIFIAFYQMLNDAIELKGAPFIFWVKDLAEADRLFTLPFSLPFIGDAVNLLPLLMVGSMVAQQKMTPQMGSTPEQAKMMNIMMPVVFGLLFYNMPSGLVLYWFLNNVLTILQQVAAKKLIVIPTHED